MTDGPFAEQNSAFSSRLSELKADLNGEFRLLFVLGSIILTAVVMPCQEPMLAL